MTGKAASALVITLTALPMFLAGQALRVRHAPKSQEEMHARVVALYDFHPHQASAEAIKTKSSEMDVFWGEMKGEPQATLPLLRAELVNPNDPPLFYMDGTQLLLSLSKSAEDGDLAAAALPRVDLGDTQDTAYFFVVHDLACAGQDVTAAALHVLDKASFRVSFPQHAMTLDQRMALMYALLSMKDDRWIGRAGERLSQEKEPKAKLALVFALFYAQTDEADALLRKVVGEGSEPEIVRQRTQELLVSAQKTGKSWMPIRGTLPDIREQRRQRLRAVSDEAIGDVEWMTRKIAQLRAKGKS